MRKIGNGLIKSLKLSVNYMPVSEDMRNLKKLSPIAVENLQTTTAKNEVLWQFYQTYSSDIVLLLKHWDDRLIYDVWANAGTVRSQFHYIITHDLFGNEIDEIPPLYTANKRLGAATYQQDALVGKKVSNSQDIRSVDSQSKNAPGGPSQISMGSQGSRNINSQAGSQASSDIDSVLANFGSLKLS
jgi:hypothetical protein